MKSGGIVFIAMVAALLLWTLFGSGAAAEAPAVQSSPPAEVADPMEEALERFAEGYDPKRSGTLAALHYAEELLRAYEETGEDAAREAVARFREASSASELAEKISSLRKAVSRISAGADGLMRGGRAYEMPDPDAMDALFSLFL